MQYLLLNYGKLLINTVTHCRVALNKVNNFKLNQDKHCQTVEEREMLVPLSSSVFIDGTISKPDQVLVDVGTGYRLLIL